MRRAAFVAAGFVARHHIELAGVTAKRIVATGGGTRVPEWMQALADCTGLPVDVVAVPEGAALGAAFQARIALGLEGRIEDAARWARIGHRVEPGLPWIAPCAERYARTFLAPDWAFCDPTWPDAAVAELYAIPLDQVAAGRLEWAEIQE